MDRRVITQEEINTALDDLPGWELREGKFHKLYKFGSFSEAIGWMVSVAIFADKLDHHPDWSNVYNKVDVELVTHDLDALSTWDLELAKKMEEYAGN